MRKGFIPIAAAVTFVAVYLLTPVPGPAAVEDAAEPGLAETASLRTSPDAAEPVSARTPAHAAMRRHASRQRPRPTDRPVRRAPAREAVLASVYFPGCNAVRAAGLAPLYRGQPGYRSEMDGDDDGIACEPHRHRRPGW